MIVTGSTAETVKDHEIGTVGVIEKKEEGWIGEGKLIIVMEGMEEVGTMVEIVQGADHGLLLGMDKGGDPRVLLADQSPVGCIDNP